MVAQVSPVYLDQSRIGNLPPTCRRSERPASQGRLFDRRCRHDGAGSRAAADTSASNNVASNTNFQVVTAALHYTNGPLLLGAAYDYNTYADRDSNVVGQSGNYGSGNVWNVAGAYDFGVVRIAAYGMYDYASFGQTMDDRTQFLGASAPIGKAGKLTLTYANAKIDYNVAGAKSDDMQMWGLAYFHDISKRTNFYAAYGQIDQDDTFFNPANRVSLFGHGRYDRCERLPASGSGRSASPLLSARRFVERKRAPRRPFRVYAYFASFTSCARSTRRARRRGEQIPCGMVRCGS